MAANVRSLIIDLFESPDGTLYAILIATVIVVKILVHLGNI